MSSPLDNWQFLVGNWTIIPEESTGADPESIEKMIVTNYPAASFIHMKSESWKGENKVSDGLSIMFYDTESNQVKIKGFSGMGFVNNYFSTAVSDDRISFDSVNENIPVDFRQFQFRYHLTKESNDRFISTLEMAGEDGEFRKFWEGVFQRSL